MKFPHLLFGFLLAVTWSSCDPSNSKETEPCQSGSAADQLNCRVNYDDWRLVSVTSDVGRPRGAGRTTTNWIEFQPECYNGAMLSLGEFVVDQSNQLSTIYWATNEVAPCARVGMRGISTKDNFATAGLLVDREGSLFLYGIDLGDTSLVTDTWYDIRVEPARSLQFRVDKTLEGINYQLEFEFERADR